MDIVIQPILEQVNLTVNEENDLIEISITELTEQVVFTILETGMGLPGKNVELQKTATHIQWRQEGGTWANLVALEDITGPEGPPGPPTAAHITIVADRGQAGDPISGQPIFYLPHATKRYWVVMNKGLILEEGVDYIRTGTEATLQTGDIAPQDRFRICEY